MLSSRIWVRLMLCGAFACVAWPAIVGAATESKSDADQATYKSLLPMTANYPDDGVVLGQAYDMVMMRKLPSICVQGISAPLGDGQTTVNFTNLEDKEQLLDSLKISISAAASFGAGSMSASADYAKTTKIGHDRNNVMATVDIVRDGTQLAPLKATQLIQLSPAGTRYATKAANGQLATPGHPAVPPDIAPFRVVCGDGYVAAIRTGAKLNMVFSRELQTSDVTEEMDVSVSGGYGPVSAKASFDHMTKDTSSNSNTSYTMFQIGTTTGALPVDLAGALTYFSSFNAQTTTPVPVEIVVRPYNELMDFPETLRTQPLPSSAVEGLPALYARLLDLSEVYVQSYTAPNSFYHPFNTVDTEIKFAHQLQVAANCVSVMLSRCTVTGNCQMETILNDAVVQKSCPALTSKGSLEQGLTAADQTAVLALIAGRPKKNTETQPSLEVLLTKVQSTEKSKFSQPGTTKAEMESPSLTNEPWTAYDYYYAYLARAPWPRTLSVKDADAFKDLSDLPNLVSSFCKVSEPSCDDVAYVNLSGDVNTASELAKKIYKEFVVKVKLAPIAAAMCASQPTHPMCQLPDVLPSYLDEKLVTEDISFGKNRGFVTIAAPPQVAVTQTPPSHPRPPLDPCEIHRCIK